MVYIKIIDNNNTIISVESLANPDFVCWQERNGVVVSCSQVRAQGVVSQSGDYIYQLYGKEPLPTSRTKEGLRAVIIAEADYDELVLQLGDDPEDINPDIPDAEDTEEIFTRAQLTAIVNDLVRANEAKDERIEMLEDCILEMSEVVYADD